MLVCGVGAKCVHILLAMQRVSGKQTIVCRVGEAGKTQARLSQILPSQGSLGLAPQPLALLWGPRDPGGWLRK